METFQPISSNSRQYVQQNQIASCLFGILLSLLLLVLPSQCSSAKDIAPSTYDASWSPITATILRKQVRANSQNPVMLYNLVQQAGRNSLAAVAYETLNRLRQEQPNNAVVLATFCLAFDVAEGDYAFINHNHKELTFTQTDQEQYANILNKARKLMPDLWLTYAVDGYKSATFPNQLSQGISLLKKAVDLAPKVSIPHYLLGRVYTRSTNPEILNNGIKELQTASALKPTMAVAPLLLFDVYSIWVPDKEKATQEKQTFLASISPVAKVDTDLLARLAKY